MASQENAPQKVAVKTDQENLELQIQIRTPNFFARRLFEAAVDHTSQIYGKKESSAA